MQEYVIKCLQGLSIIAHNCISCCEMRRYGAKNKEQKATPTDLLDPSLMPTTRIACGDLLFLYPFRFVPLRYTTLAPLKEGQLSLISIDVQIDKGFCQEFLSL